MITAQGIDIIFGNHEHDTAFLAQNLLFVLFTFWLGLLVYVLVRGKGMQERQLEQAREMQAAQTAYIKSVASSSGSATDQIASAKSLLDSGAITHDEFNALKSKALAG